MEQRTQVAVECPQCHWKQFVETEIDRDLLRTPLALEIQAQLEAWMATHCPDHLNVITQLSRN